MKNFKLVYSCRHVIAILVFLLSPAAHSQSADELSGTVICESKPLAYAELVAQLQGVDRLNFGTFELTGRVKNSHYYEYFCGRGKVCTGQKVRFSEKFYMNAGYRLSGQPLSAEKYLAGDVYLIRESFDGQIYLALSSQEFGHNMREQWVKVDTRCLVSSDPTGLAKVEECALTALMSYAFHKRKLTGPITVGSCPKTTPLLSGHLRKTCSQFAGGLQVQYGAEEPSDVCLSSKDEAEMDLLIQTQP